MGQADGLRLGGGQTALATAGGGEALDLLGLLPGNWVGGLDQWRLLVGAVANPGVRLLERMGRTARPTPTPLAMS